MKYLHTASTLALLLTCVPAMAEEPVAIIAEGTLLAQLGEDALALLSDTRPAAELSSEELVARIRSLRQALRSGELPEDVTERFKDLLKQARSEAAARDEVASQAASEQPGPEQAAPATEETTQSQPEASPESDAAPQLPNVVVSLLSDTRPASELSAEELTVRIRQLRQALKLEEITADAREQLQGLQNQARSEVAARAASAKQSAGPVTTDETPDIREEPSRAQLEVVPEPEVTPQLPEDIATLLNDPRPLEDLSSDELSTRTRELRQALRRPDLPEGVRERLQNLQAQVRSSAAVREAVEGTEPPPPAADEAAETVEAPSETSPEMDAVPQLPGNVTAILNDTRPLAEFSDEELTARARALRRAGQLEELPASVKEQLLDLQRQARREIDSRVAAASQDKPVANQEVTEQPALPEASSPQEAAPELSEATEALLNNGQPLSELSADQLTARILDLQQAAREEQLDPDVQEQLQSLQAAAQNELATRETAANQETAQRVTPEQPTVEAAPSVAEETVQTQPEIAPQLPEDVVALLSDQRPLSELSAEELTARIRTLRQALRREDLSEAVKDQLRGLQGQARSEVAAREEAANQETAQQATPAQPEPEAATPEDPAPVPTEPAPRSDAASEVSDAATLLDDTRDVRQLSPEELTARMRAARRLAQDESLAEETRTRLAEIARSARRELMSRDQAAEGAEPQPDGAPQVPAPATDAAQKQNAEAPPAVDQSNVQALDGNVADPQSEAEARAYLEDQTSVEAITDEALRRRVEDMRDLLASNELSRDTERSVRRKLRVERDVLRARVAEKESQKAQQRAEGQNNPEAPSPSTSDAAGNTQVPSATAGSNATQTENNTQVTTNNTEITTNITNITNLPPVTVVLADRRPPQDLDEREIRWRISVYRDAIRDEDYEAEERLAWQEQMEEDRLYLRRRLLEDRQRRQQELQIDYDESEFEDFDLAEVWDETEPPPRDVYVDEVEDEELVRVLAAPPRRKVERRYSVAEIEARPQLRDTIARIEIDTLRFGFNEARVREEEIEKLDRIGEILERILRKNPKEVFLIEGHTDAVGSDAYNLKLSRLRAEAVKEALTTYFVIHPRNLQTAGFGERFLKIPTADAEEENRRVSIARATVLVGELSD